MASGELEYKGETVSLEISDVELNKSRLANPASGALSVEVGGIVFILNYDGNAIVTVTYSYNGADHKIVINIHTGVLPD